MNRNIQIHYYINILTKIGRIIPSYCFDYQIPLTNTVVYWDYIPVENNNKLDALQFKLKAMLDYLFNQVYNIILTKLGLYLLLYSSWFFII